jgi:hypothetical protein
MVAMYSKVAFKLLVTHVIKLIKWKTRNTTMSAQFQNPI